MECRALRGWPRIGAKAVVPSSRGSNRSGPAVTGAATIGGRGRVGAGAGMVRPGAQEVASSARRRGNRRRRAGPYTPGCYYGVVYLSRLDREASRPRIGAIIQRLRPMKAFLGIVEL